jgi:hypothetical protein
MAFMDTPDFRTHKDGWTLLAGFEAGLQSDSVSLGCVQGYPASLRAQRSNPFPPQQGRMDRFVAEPVIGRAFARSVGFSQ